MATTLVTMQSGTGTQHPIEIMSWAETYLWLNSGVLNILGTEFKVQQQASPNMSVLIGQGRAVLKQSDNQVCRPVRLYDTDYTQNIGANSSGNPRIDAIVLYIDMVATPNAGVTNVAKITAVQGTPAGSPVAPLDATIQTAIGNGNAFIRLANVTVASGATQILTANIADTRVAPTPRHADGVYNAGASTGAANTYAVTVSGISEYKDYMEVSFIAHQDNTGASNLNLNALGNKSIVSGGGTITADQILTGDLVTVKIIGSTAYIVNTVRNSGGKRKLYATGVSGTYDIDARLYDVVHLVLGGTTTIRIQYLKQSKASLPVFVQQDGTGGRDYSFNFRKSDGSYNTSPSTSFGMGLLKGTTANRYDTYVVCSPNETDVQVAQLGSDFQ